MNRFIIDSIDEATLDSEMCVLESMMLAYAKTIDIMENTDETVLDQFSIVQEAVVSSDESKNADAEAKKSKPKDDNVVMKLINTIIQFFKTIGRKIASFFKKSKETILEKLKKFEKKDTKSIPDTIQEKIDNISKNRSEKHNSKIKPDQVEKGKSDKKKDKSDSSEKATTIVIKEKKIRTRIIFPNWIKYLESIINQLDNFNKNNAEVGVKQKNMFRLYHFFSHKYTVSEVTKYIEQLISLFKEVNIKMDEATKKLDEIKKHYSQRAEDIRKDRSIYIYNSKDSERRKINRHISNLSQSMANVSICIQDMTAYLAEEFDIYGIILDTIEPVISKNKAAEEAAEREAAEKKKSEEAIRVEVVKKDE